MARGKPENFNRPDYNFRLAGDGGEPVTDELAKAVKIVDRKLKVLVVDSQPRWDFKFIQRGLERDRRGEPKFILTEGDPRAMKAGEPFLPAFPATRAELLAYDLLILGDIPASYLTKEQQEWVREFVAEGGGLIQIAGKASGPATFTGTPLADVLHAQAADVREAGRRELIEAGARKEVLMMVPVVFLVLPVTVVFAFWPGVIGLHLATA